MNQMSTNMNKIQYTRLLIEAVTNDGYRDQSMADDNSRRNFSEYLDSLRKIYHQDTNVVYLDGNYEENYKKAKAAIDQVYNFDL